MGTFQSWSFFRTDDSVFGTGESDLDTGLITRRDTLPVSWVGPWDIEAVDSCA